MEKKGIDERLQDQLQLQNILIECIYVLHVNRDLEVAMGQLLSIIAQYYRADRVYVFQLDAERKWMDNTYEWCREGVPSEKSKNQHLEISALSRWMPWFEESEAFALSFLREELARCRGERRKQYPRERGALLTAPLFYKGWLMGFVGVDYPSRNSDTVFLLQSLARFLAYDLFCDY